MEPFRRVNYQPGMVLSDTDFLDEQRYFDGRLRLHNRLCIGAAVIEGLVVEWQDRDLVVSPGLAFDRLGRELIVGKPLVVERIDGRYEGDLVCITRDEIGDELTPRILPQQPESENLMPQRVIEGVKAFVASTEFVATHKTADRGWIACNGCDALPIARLGEAGKIGSVID